MANQNPGDMEKAEGSRETVNANLDAGDPAQERYGDAKERPDAEHTGGGITNRPLSREIEEQEQLPPRGTAKNPDEDHS